MAGGKLVKVDLCDISSWRVVAAWSSADEQSGQGACEGAKSEWGWYILAGTYSHNAV